MHDYKTLATRLVNFLFVLAESLKSKRRFSEAGRVFLDYAEDVEEAMVALLEGSLWEESLRLLHLHQRCDLIETHLLPALLEAHESRLSLFQDLRSKFTQHSSRLVVVRENKKLKQAAILGVACCCCCCDVLLL